MSKPKKIIYRKQSYNKNYQYYTLGDNDEEIPVRPLTTFGQDVPDYTWTFIDDNGNRYTPNLKNNDSEEIRQGEEPGFFEKAMSYSNKHYYNPVLGAAARWNDSWRNDINPVKALLHSPFNFANPYTMAASAVDNLTNDNGLIKTQRLYNESDGSSAGRQAWQRSLLGDLGEGLMVLPAAGKAVKQFQYPWKAVTNNVGLGRNASGEWNGWIRIGNTEIRPNRSSLGVNKLVESRPTLSEGMKNNGWIINNEGFAIKADNPNGPRFVWNGKGWQSETSLAKTNSEMSKKAIREANNSQLLKQRKNGKRLVGKLFDMGFTDFDPKIWFKNRPWMTGTADAVTQEDIDFWYSHMPEYYELANKLKGHSLYKNKQGRWIGKFMDGEKEVDPQEYIIAHSKAFNNAGLHYDGKKWYSGMSRKNYNKLIKNGGVEKDAVNWNTTNEDYATEIKNNVDPTNGIVVKNMVGKYSPKEINIAKTKSNYPKPASYTEFGEPAGKIVKQDYKNKGVIDFPIIYTDQGMGRPEHWRIFGDDTQVKFLRGNNGNFNMSELNPFKSLIAPVLTVGTAYGVSQ